MADRYFVEKPILSDPVALAGSVSLAGPEAHHLMHVMRAECGTRVVLFDGTGFEYQASVERVGKNAVELRILVKEEIDRELPMHITLGVALPKGDRQKWLVEKAVEIGVAEVIPLKTRRGVAQPVEQALDRLRRSVIEASKQCGRNRLMEIAPPQSWEEFLKTTSSCDCRVVAHPGDATDAFSPHRVFLGQKKIILAIGPEGGFAPEEVETALQSGWTAAHLGRRILRVETAAIYLASLAANGAL